MELYLINKHRHQIFSKMRTFIKLLVCTIQWFCFISLLLAVNVKAQTYVTAPMTGTPAAGSYYSNSSITLNPTFSFTASAGQSLQLYIQTDCLPLATNFNANQNYILTSTPRVSGLTNTSMLFNQGTCQLMQMVQYIDGLGRPIQTVQVKGSPNGNDLVQPITYDQFGREPVKYLPYALTNGTSDGSYKTDALTAGAGQGKFYNPAGSAATQQANGIVNTSFPFSATVFEPSPLNRVTEQGAPGASWQPVPGSTAGHTVKIAYGANGYSDVIMWAVNAASNGLTGGNTYYGAGQLAAVTTTDENGFSTIEYKDKQGRVVCKKSQLTSSPTVTFVSTCYVYDDLNNLAYVIPPNPAGAAYSASIAETDAICKNYIYCYHYDERNRLVQKRIPGKDWDFMVYNQLDQLVLSQDAIQRATYVWTVTKYDALGRVILTGLWTSAGQSQSALQSSIYAGAQWDKRDYTDNVTGYNVTSYPAMSKILTINYYDDYNNIPGNPASFTTTGFSTMTRGLLTATKTSVLNTMGNTTPDMLNTLHGYDDLARNVIMYQQHYLASILSPNNYDKITNSFDFTNELLTTTRQHYKNVSNAAVLGTTIVNNYTYDHMGRKTQTKEQIDNGDQVLLSQTDYNEIGQVTAKHLNSVAGAPFLQDITYKYNERGWLKRINDPAMTPTATRMFSEQLNYDSVKYAALPLYNGNIAEQDYNAAVSTRQHVVYSYDPLNRLTNGTSSANFSENNIVYDNLGNITSLTRGGNTGVYAYNGNQLSTVSGITTSSYGYDANGNANHDGRTGVGITYNMLNLPQTITGTNINITYTYDASGQKLRKVSTSSGTTTNTDYIAGIQYKTDGATVDFIQTEEGRAINGGGSYNYEYTLTDHLGNNRVTFDQTHGKVGEDDYYPFGLNAPWQHSGNNYLYNKKELQPEINEYDYGARFYDPAIGRWGHIDPKAELYFSSTPYAYASNTPVNAIDPDGNIVIFVAGQNTGNGSNVSYWQQKYWGPGINNVTHRNTGMQRLYVIDFAKAVENHFHDTKAVFLDGADGGWSETLEDGIATLGIGKSNLDFDFRYAKGSEHAGFDIGEMIKNLKRDKHTGVITESIKVIAHSMGGAYAHALVEEIIKYVEDHPKDCVGLSISESDFDPYQGGQLKVNPVVNIKQFIHKNFWNIFGMGWLANEQEQGIENKDVTINSGTSTDHAISTFFNDISSLDEGTYKWNGKNWIKQ
jgi:RHS repeat-associated protein